MAKKIIIRKLITIEKEIEVEFPYYYEHDLSCHNHDSVIYGKIDGKTTTSVHEKQDQYGKMSYEIEKEEWDGDGSYFNDKYNSTEAKYNKAKERLKEFFNCL